MKVVIKNLMCFGKHGVLKEENILGQKFVVSAEMEVGEPVGDNIATAVNYAEVSSFIVQYVREEVFKLIETLANNIAIEILKRFNVKAVKIRVDKPFAPVGLPVDTVAVETEKRWNKAYLSIGSNIGDKKAYLDGAVERLKNNDSIRVTKVADYIATEPYGYTDQEEFLNSAVEIETLLSPYELLEYTSEIEKEANRKRDIHWGPRTLDVDILLYDNFVSNDKKLTVPHIDMHNRDFVLRPLCQIAPYAWHNGLNKTILELYNTLNKNCPK